MFSDYEWVALTKRIPRLCHRGPDFVAQIRQCSASDNPDHTAADIDENRSAGLEKVGFNINQEVIPSSRNAVSTWEQVGGKDVGQTWPRHSNL